ncbi:aldehyde dehydrogenase family protein [Cupriavidus basilensis]
MELPAADLRPQRGRGAGDRQRLRGQARPRTPACRCCAWPNWPPRPACPKSALNIVTGYGHEAGAALARHPGINHISFTGSPQTGKLVAQLAAENHVPVTLELGGKSPQIVFADADMDALVPVIVNGIVQNAGQTCSAGSRVLVERPLYNALLDRLASVFESLRVGPSELDLECGPLISRKQQQRVWDFVSDAHAGISVMARGADRRRSAGVRLLPGADAVPRRAARPPARARGSLRPAARRHAVR